MPFNTGLKFTRRKFIKGTSVVAAGIAAPSILSIRSALAAYPERPIKIVVANTPGGPSDLVGRMLTAVLQQATGKTFVIENIGGRRRQHRHGQRRAGRTGWLHAPALH